jgi:acyl carrier protein
LAQKLRERLTGELINMYGPTETTVWSVAHRVGTVNGSVPIGRPIANTELYVMDDHAQIVPIGVPGELWIGGLGLARGYQGRAQLSAEKFVPHPFRADPQARLYRTGDIVRYRPDGNLEFLGRIDQQVKIRGHRIELGEIESTLAQHGAVRECVAAIREDKPDDKRLAVYVIPQAGAKPTLNELRAFLQSKLPDYMVPSIFIFLETLPLTPNGKVDRRALPAIVPSPSHAGAPLARPRTPTEEALAKIWTEVLSLKQVGTDDNFFELGGHSLLVMQVISRVREAFQVDLPMRRFFETPVIANLASVIHDLVLENIGDLPEDEANRLAVDTDGMGDLQ